MAELSSATYQYISQLGATRLIDVSAGPEGPNGVTSSLLIGANGWHNGARLPHEVVEDLDGAAFNKQTVEGIEYFLVPEVSSNLPGRLSEYAQRTGVADLQNPPGGGVNAARQHVNTAEATVAPEAVSSWVEDTKDAWDEARDERLARDSQVSAAIGHGTGSDSAKAPAEKSIPTPSKATPKKADDKS